MDIQQPSADALLAAFEPPLSPEALLRLEINLHLPAPGDEAALHVALRVGLERMYVVKQLSSFLRALDRGEKQTFGKGLALDPAAMRFDRMDQRILALLSETEAALRPCEALGYHPPQGGKFMPLSEQAARRLLRLLRARPYRLVSGAEIVSLEAIDRRAIDIGCALREEGRGLALDVRLPQDLRPVTRDFEFIRTRGEIVQLPPEQRRALRVLAPYAEAGEAHFLFARREIERVVSEVLPQLETGCAVTLSDTLAARVRREPLRARVYIDREGERIAVRVQFQYGDTAVDPFARAEATESDGPLLVRDAKAEFEVLDTLAQAGFHVSEGRVYLSGARRALRFIMEGVAALQKVAEIFASEDFRRMRPRRPQLSGRLGISGGALQLAVYDGDTPIEELAELMQALRDKKKYFRLKDGSFLTLTDMAEWDELAELVGDVGEAGAPDEGVTLTDGGPVMALRAYRTAYLVGMLVASRLPVEVDEGAREAAGALAAVGEALPKVLSRVLRGYQERGFQWIQALYRLRMGGVLADDMGLGKTLQVIAAVMWAKDRDGVEPTLVVSPTSLVYNWEAEVNRFAPSLSTAVVDGNQRARFLKWAELRRAADTDIIITSYPLLRRDINLISGQTFRFVVLDEAQHIKNPQSLAAVSASRLAARTRLALTGTPMENNPGELWSIFNFVLPGYLMTLPQFMRRYGDGTGLDSLGRRIRPFLLRRLKADVLPELPTKIESRVLADMPREQKNVYTAAATQLYDRVRRVLDDKGLGRGRMEVLSAITQLRQICCHPALVMESYAGSSGKMDALMEILGEALASGRRVLLFSQFTSMLAILRRRLDETQVTSLYLDGKTPTGQRMELVNRFNAGEGRVFLISLKAGGAGLNLTGADTVIHYDPWWNPAAEDQATDRAHRIGQKKVVQVLRLITRGTIEEQVAKLSERKRARFDAVVTAGEQMPSDLTEAEIMSLFS